LLQISVEKASVEIRGDVPQETVWGSSKSLPLMVREINFTTATIHGNVRISHPLNATHEIAGLIKGSFFNHHYSPRFPYEGALWVGIVGVPCDSHLAKLLANIGSPMLVTPTTNNLASNRANLGVTMF